MGDLAGTSASFQRKVAFQGAEDVLISHQLWFQKTVEIVA